MKQYEPLNFRRKLQETLYLKGLFESRKDTIAIWLDTYNPEGTLRLEFLRKDLWSSVQAIIGG